MKADKQGGGLIWPDVPRLAFGDNGTRPVAAVGWSLRSSIRMYGYVEGYAWAARTLYAEALRHAKSPEYVIFPLAFLWRHHIELSMKWVIALGRKWEGDTEGKAASGHDLMKLWKECRTHLEPMAGDEPDDTLANVGFTLEQLHRIDPGGDGWRYPVELRADPVAVQTSTSLAGVPEHVSLPQLQEAMEALSTFFDCVAMQLRQAIEDRGEAAALALEFAPHPLDDFPDF